MKRNDEINHGMIDKLVYLGFGRWKKNTEERA